MEIEKSKISILKKKLSKRGYIFSDEQIKQKIIELKNLPVEIRNKSYNIDKYKILYGLENAENELQKTKDSHFKISEKEYIKKYGEQKGKEIWTEYCNKRKESYRKNKLNGKKYNNGRNLEWYELKYGKELGNSLWLERNKKQSYRFSIDYYKEKFKENWEIEYDKYLKSMSHTSKKAFIKKYGENDGIKRYWEFINKLKIHNGFKCNLESFQKKYGVEIGKEKYYEWLEKVSINIQKANSKGYNYSKISQKLFWELYEELQDKNNIYFFELNKEYYFYLGVENYKFCLVDFKMNNKIIEFQGEYFHSKPEAIIRDKIKKEELENKGYKVLYVWDKEYKKNRFETIKKCLEFLEK